MRRFVKHALILSAVSALAVPAMAGAPVHHFTRDGESYSYLAERAADGTVLLVGQADGAGQPFSLRIAGRRVSGRVGLDPVSFTLSNDTVARLAAEVPVAAETQTASVDSLAAN